MGTMKTSSFLPCVGTKRTRSYLGKPKKTHKPNCGEHSSEPRFVFTCILAVHRNIFGDMSDDLFHVHFTSQILGMWWAGSHRNFLWIPIVFDPPKLPLRVTHPQKLGETHGSNWLRSLRDKPVIGNLLMWQRWHQQIPTVTTNRVISPPTLQAKRVSRAACHLSTWVHFVISLGVLLSENF